MKKVLISRLCKMKSVMFLFYFFLGILKFCISIGSFSITKNTVITVDFTSDKESEKYF